MKVVFMPKMAAAISAKPVEPFKADAGMSIPGEGSSSPIKPGPLSTQMAALQGGNAMDMQAARQAQQEAQKQMDMEMAQAQADQTSEQAKQQVKQYQDEAREATRELQRLSQQQHKMQMDNMKLTMELQAQKLAPPKIEQPPKKDLTPFLSVGMKRLQKTMSKLSSATGTHQRMLAAALGTELLAEAFIKASALKRVSALDVAVYNMGLIKRAEIQVQTPPNGANVPKATPPTPPPPTAHGQQQIGAANGNKNAIMGSVMTGAGGANVPKATPPPQPAAAPAAGGVSPAAQPKDPYSLSIAEMQQQVNQDKQNAGSGRWVNSAKEVFTPNDITGRSEVGDAYRQFMADPRGYLQSNTSATGLRDAGANWGSNWGQGKQDQNTVTGVLKRGLGSAAGGIGAALGWGADTVRNTAFDVGGYLGNAASKGFRGLRTGVNGGLDAIAGLGNNNMAQVENGWNAMKSGWKQIGSGLVDGAKGVGTVGLTALGGAGAGTVGSGIARVGIWNAGSQGVRDLMERHTRAPRVGWDGTAEELSKIVGTGGHYLHEPGTSPGAVNGNNMQGLNRWGHGYSDMFSGYSTPDRQGYGNPYADMAANMLIPALMPKVTPDMYGQAPGSVGTGVAGHMADYGQRFGM